MSLFAGSTALTLITKLYAISYVESFGYFFIPPLALPFVSGNFFYETRGTSFSFSAVLIILVKFRIYIRYYGDCFRFTPIT